MGDLPLNSFLQMFKDGNENGQKFCFILGSGASIESGIASGIDMSQKWFEELKEIYKESGKNDFKKLKKNIKADKISKVKKEEENELKICSDENRKEVEEKYEKIIKKINENYNIDLNKDDIKSEDYFPLYDLRFYPEYANGYHAIESLIEKGNPSYGYFLLAKLLSNEKYNSNLVITTNFDTMIEDALYINAEKKPIIIGHESLIDFLNIDANRPIIAKIHRGLFYNPLNSSEDTSCLQEGWELPLQEIFSTYTPIVIGYGGGDKSLMEFMERESTRFSKKMYWCYRNKLEDNIKKFIAKKDSIYKVKIEGFDTIMFQMLRELDMVDLERDKEKVRDLIEDRLKNYDEKYNSFIEVRIEKAKEHIEDNPEDDWGYFNLGQIYHEIGNHEYSIDNYSEAIKLNRDNPRYYFRRGLSYCILENYNEAIKDCNKAIELDPNKSIYYYLRGSIYYNLEQYEESIKDYDKAIELDPDNSIYYKSRGNAYYNLGECEESIKDYDKAIELDPDNNIYYYNRGKSHYNLKDYPKALEDINKSIDLDKNYKKAYEKRVEIYEALGESDKAEDDRKLLETSE